MNRKAVEAARIEFNRARDNIEALATLKPGADFEEIQTRWAALLSAADRMFNKLKEGASASPQSKHLFKRGHGHGCIPPAPDMAPARRDGEQASWGMVREFFFALFFFDFWIFDFRRQRGDRRTYSVPRRGGQQNPTA